MKTFKIINNKSLFDENGEPIIPSVVECVEYGHPIDGDYQPLIVKG